MTTRESPITGEPRRRSLLDSAGPGRSPLRKARARPVIVCLFGAEGDPLLRKPREERSWSPREQEGRAGEDGAGVPESGRERRERRREEGRRERARRKEKTTGERGGGKEGEASTHGGHRSAPRPANPRHTRRDPHDQPGPTRPQRSPRRPR